MLWHFFVLSRAVSGWNLFTQTEESSCGSGSACRDASLLWHCSFRGRHGRPGGLTVSNVVLCAWVAGMLCMGGYKWASEDRERGGLVGNLSPQDGRLHGAGPPEPAFPSLPHPNILGMGARRQEIQWLDFSRESMVCSKERAPVNSDKLIIRLALAKGTTYGVTK